MHAVRLNKGEIEAYLRMSSNDHPSPENIDRLFSMLKPVSQRNLVNAVRLHLKNHLTDDGDLAQHFPCLTKSETDVTRNHIRKKLNVPADQDLQKFLTNLLIEKGYLDKGGKE